jgi:hypothetical protein
MLLKLASTGTIALGLPVGPGEGEFVGVPVGELPGVVCAVTSRLLPKMKEAEIAVR